MERMRLTLLLLILGLALAAAWGLGPLMGLAGATSRVVTALLLAAVPGGLICASAISRAVQRRASRRLARGLEELGRSHQQTAPEEEQAELARQRRDLGQALAEFEEAGGSLATQPWYLVLGISGEGPCWSPAEKSAASTASTAAALWPAHR